MILPSLNLVFSGKVKTMRKIITSMFATLDGFMPDPTKDVTWVSELEQEVTSHMSNVALILLDEATYQVVVRYWPNATPETEDPIALSYMNNTPKIILSEKLTEASWGTFNNAIALNEQAFVKEVTKLKRQPGGDIVIVNSPQVMQLLAKHDLIDDYHLLLQPIILGSGSSLFANIHSKIKLMLASVKTFDGGTVALHYKGHYDNHK